MAGGTGPYAFSVSPFTPLPYGLTLNANTGATNIAASETLAALNIANGATVALGAIPPAPAPEFGDGDALLGAPGLPVPEPSPACLFVFCAAIGSMRRWHRHS